MTEALIKEIEAHHFAKYATQGIFKPKTSWLIHVRDVVLGSGSRAANLGSSQAELLDAPEARLQEVGGEPLWALWSGCELPQELTDRPYFRVAFIIDDTQGGRALRVGYCGGPPSPKKSPAIILQRLPLGPEGW